MHFFFAGGLKGLFVSRIDMAEDARGRVSG
jgi:hypothetical protein